MNATPLPGTSRQQPPAGDGRLRNTGSGGINLPYRLPAGRGRGGRTSLISGSSSGGAQTSGSSSGGGRTSLISGSSSGGGRTSGSSGGAQNSLISGPSSETGDLTVILRAVKDLKQGQMKLEGMCKGIVEQEKKVMSAVSELKQLVEDQTKKNFSIKGSSFELPLRREVAHLFCKELSRYPPSEEIQRVVKKVLPREDLSKKYVVETCLKEANALLSTFRTEERRRILGHKPTENLCHLPTAAIATNIGEYLKAPEEVKELYVNHVAILRKYVRQQPTCVHAKNFYGHFKTWLSTAYPVGVQEDEWQLIVEEDRIHPYHSHPLAYPSEQLAEGAGGDTEAAFSPINPDPINPETYEFRPEN